MMKTEDAEIISRFNKPAERQAAFSMLVEKYHQKLYWHIRRIVLDHEDANDVLQNTFIKIWKGLESFRSDAQLYTWLYRIATNESLTHLKMQKKSNAFSADEGEWSIAEQLKADAYFDGDEIMLKLQMAIAELPEKQRVVFLMRYYDQVKYEDMSTILETSVGALKASYHHAVKKIEKYLTGD